MEKYLFMSKVLQLVSQGQFFRKAFAVTLRVLAVIVALVALFSWIPEWKSLSGASNEKIVGVIIFQLLFVIAAYMVVHTILIRARNIIELPEADFTVIPIAAISLKLLGEIYACMATVMSVAGGILIWFIRGDAFFSINRLAPFIPNLSKDGGFLGGIEFMAGGFFVAFCGLVFFYYLAESVVVIVDIANNIKTTKQIAEQYRKK